MLVVHVSLKTLDDKWLQCKVLFETIKFFASWALWASTEDYSPREQQNWCKRCKKIQPQGRGNQRYGIQRFYDTRWAREFGTFGPGYNCSWICYLKPQNLFCVCPEKFQYFNSVKINRNPRWRRKTYKLWMIYCTDWGLQSNILIQSE